MKRQDEHPSFTHTDGPYTHEEHHDPLLMTKCCVPVTSHPLIVRSQLMTLLDTARHYPLTLVSAPAGFGKTLLLTSWLQSQSAENSLAAWLSLNEHDNSPLRFWRYVLLALNQGSSDSCTPTLTLFHSSQDPPLESVITTLLNAFNQTTRMHFLILDDYHVINEPLIHRSLSYLIEHLPEQLRVILLTRADPPLNCARLRARRKLLEVRTEHLRCDLQDAARFWRDVMGIEVANVLLEEAVNRTEGWLAGLQLLGLSWQKCTNQAEMLAQLHGTQRHIRDYLLEEVLQHQSLVLQRFLLCTALLDRLSASLCNAVMQTEDSQTLLEQLERANLFVIPLDEQRHWYRYHHLFAEMLRSRLTQTYHNEVCGLHQRASR
jgi:LuxR family maltose regulon positive regulatory protein